jgi:Ras-related protein Rab-1A
MDKHESENTPETMNEISLNTPHDAQVDRVLENVSKYEYMFSVCLIGNTNVGKTSLLTRYCDNIFKEKYTNTIGVDFRIISLKHKDHNIKLHLWDTAGQERFKSISVNYFRKVHGFFFVFDLSNRESFDQLVNWIDLAKNYNKHAMVNFLVGNKSDLERHISEKEAIEFAESRNLIYYEASAKTSDNVEKSFHYMTFKLFEYYSRNKQIYEMFTTQGTKIENESKEITNSRKISLKPDKKCSC